MMANRIEYYVHAKTGERYPASEYVNHGYGGIHRGKNDLPKDGYPYLVLFLRHGAFMGNTMPDQEQADPPEVDMDAIARCRTIPIQGSEDVWLLMPPDDPQYMVRWNERTRTFKSRIEVWSS